MTKKYFYFAPPNKCLDYGDNRPIVVGETHTVECTPIPCRQGLHASERVIDALKYAKSEHLYVVELGGEIVEGTDKLAAQSRKYVKYADIKNVLREFARRQALINIEKIRPYTDTDAYQTILRYLKTGDDTLRSAAWSAA